MRGAISRCYTVCMGQGRSYIARGNRNQSRFFILLSVILVIILAVWGIPMFIEYVAGSGNEGRESQTVSSIPPQRPVLNPLPEATNSATIIVEGFSSPKVETQLFLDSFQKDSLVTTNEGNFRFVVELPKGEHSVMVKAVGDGGKSSDSETRRVFFDNAALSLEVSEPKEGAEIIGGKYRLLTVAGKVNKPEVTLKVGGNFVKVGNDGKFSGTYELAEGNNEIGIVAVDPAGNVAESKIRVKFSL